MNDIKRPKQKAKREIRRNNIALDDYMFERKMQSLYYGAKPKSDDLPAFFKLIRSAYRRARKELKALPKTLGAMKGSVKKYPARYLLSVLIAIVATVFIASRFGGKPKTPAAQPIGNAAQQETGSQIPLNQTPEFPVVLPQGKTAKDVGGFAKVSPPGSPAAYAYKDTISGISILVTEQQLPESFKAETSKEVEKLAIGYNATQAVKTEKVEFFVGTNTNGQQSVITYTKTLLILLKSSNKISNERWQTYIEDLR
jgi:hypothetical protein